jgi:hypothetical protein
MGDAFMHHGFNWELWDFSFNGFSCLLVCGLVWLDLCRHVYGALVTIGCSFFSACTDFFSLSGLGTLGQQALI